MTYKLRHLYCPSDPRDIYFLQNKKQKQQKKIHPQMQYKLTLEGISNTASGRREQVVETFDVDLERHREHPPNTYLNEVGGRPGGEGTGGS